MGRGFTKCFQGPKIGSSGSEMVLTVFKIVQSVLKWLQWFGIGSSGGSTMVPEVSKRFRVCQMAPEF